MNIRRMAKQSPVASCRNNLDLESSPSAHTSERSCVVLYNGRWQADDNDPQGEMNIQVVLDPGGTIWPVQRVMKRFKNGAEDGLHAYGVFVGKEADR